MPKACCLLAMSLLLTLCACAYGPRPAPDPAVALANRLSASGPRYREGAFGSGDDRLHYAEAGSGPLVILYHGFPSFWLSWFDQMEALKGRYRVVAVDAPGSGRSARPLDAARYRVPLLADQLDRFARAIGGDRRFILIGDDWGGALAWSYAQANPQRLHCLVAMSAPSTNQFLDLLANDSEQQARSAYMRRLRQLTRESVVAGDVHRRLFETAYRVLATDGSIGAEQMAAFEAVVADADGLSAAVNWYKANIPDPGVSQPALRWPDPPVPASMPVLLLSGEADQTFVGDFPERAGPYATRLTVRRLPGVGHWTPMQRPALANAAIADFLDDSGCAAAAQADRP